MAVKVAPRIAINVLTLIVFSVVMVVFAFLTFVTGVLFDNSYPVTVTMPDAGGVLSRQEVTVMGRAVGVVDGAELVDGGVELTLKINGDFSVPAEANVRVLRRSPIGEQAVELTPVNDEWTAAESGAQIQVDPETGFTIPTTVSELLDRTVRIFSALDAENTGIVVHEAATLFEGRTEQIKQLNLDVIDFGETILAGREDIEALLATSEPLLRNLDEHADDLERLFEDGGDLAEVLADNRANLESILRTAPNFLNQFEALILNTRANVQCLTLDLISVNDMLLGPSTATGAPAQYYETKLDEVQMAIDKHTFFFQLGIPVTIQPDPETGLGWARIKFELDQLSSGDRYAEPVPTPPTLPGAACETDEWGTGVNAVRQADAQPVTPTSPGVLYAPLVAETGPGQVDPPGLAAGGPTGGSAPLPATGGGLALLAVAGMAGATLVGRRR